MTNNKCLKLDFVNRNEQAVSEELFAAVLTKAEIFLKEDLGKVVIDSSFRGDDMLRLAQHDMHGNESGQELEISLVLMDNAQIHEINRAYRKVDRPTDVIAFSFMEGKRFPGEKLIGEIFISVERAEKQAQEQDHSLDEELRILFTHGVLHVLGYDHEKSEDKVAMDKKTGEILN